MIGSLLLFIASVSSIAVNPGGCPASIVPSGGGNVPDITCCVSFMMPGSYDPEHVVIFHWYKLKQVVDYNCGRCILQFDLSRYNKDFIDRFPLDIPILRPDWKVQSDWKLSVFSDGTLQTCPPNYYCAMVIDPAIEGSETCLSLKRSIPKNHPRYVPVNIVLPSALNATNFIE